MGDPLNRVDALANEPFWHDEMCYVVCVMETLYICHRKTSHKVGTQPVVLSDERPGRPRGVAFYATRRIK